MGTVIHFRVAADRKAELQRVADQSGITLGELCRNALEAVEVLFDDTLTFADVIRSVPYLKRVIAARREFLNPPDDAHEAASEDAAGTPPRD